MDEKVIQSSSLKQIIDRMFPDKINPDCLAQVLQSLKRQRKVSLKEIADLILFIADTSHREWSLEIILKSINETFENINWRDVYEKFFESDLKIWNKEYLYTLVDCWVYISGIITVPYEIFFRKWKNREDQIEFFKILLDCDEKRTQVYSNVFFERLVTKDDVKSAKYKKSIEYESNFNSVELFKCLKEIEAVEIVNVVRDKSPEYCILGLASVQPFCEDILDELLVHLSEGVASQLVYYILFSRYRTVVLYSFKRCSGKVLLTKILDILLEHKMLPVIAEVPEPADLCYDIIILSSRRDHLNLEIWLSNCLKKNPVSFIKYLSNKLLSTVQKEPTDDVEGPDKRFLLKSESDMFPFNRQTINNVLKILEGVVKDLSDDCLNVIREIKSKMTEIKGLEKPNYSDKATTFISEVINSQVDVEDSVVRLAELAKGDEYSVTFAKRIFSLLIDNYSSLYRLPNSDMLAIFLGELIRRKILFKPFLKVILQLIKNSLKYPENDREYTFAFRILEIFFNDVPEFFLEIEDIENVRHGLIKKDLVVVDEDSQRELDFDELLNILFNKEEDISGVENFLSKEFEQAISNMKVSNSTIPKSPSLFDENLLSKNFNISYGQISRYLLKNLNTDRAENFLHINTSHKTQFFAFFVQKGFSLIRLLFTYKFKDEVKYCEHLGAFLGKILIRRDIPVLLDIFDFRSFLLKSIEYRRISVSISFIVSFLKEGKYSRIFVPCNPWLMSIMNLLAELHCCTLADIRVKIYSLYSHFGLKLTCKSTLRMREHLVKYVIEFDGILKQVIAAALDFSVREICNRIVKSCFTVAKSTAASLFNKIGGENRFFLFRNLLVNLTRSLIHISAQEPLKASMCGNITHFLKLSMNELPLETVYSIVSQNLLICCLIIEKAGITHVNETVSSFYNELLLQEPAQNERLLSGLDPKNSLRILSESCFVEKVNIRSVENVEYQEIRSFLIQIGKKMPTKKKDYISEEWHTLLGSNRSHEFKRIISVISNSPDRDEMCLSLCKYLVGHALKTNCSEEYIFGFIASIFEISPKCKREVVGWLIYSEDYKKFNIPLVKKFIECDFVCLEELDQSLSKLLKIEDQKFLDFVVDLLDTLILQDIKLCTVYDFIYTIESLNKVNDNPRIFEFFKSIESGMMKFQDGANDFNMFDEFLKDLHANIPPTQYLLHFREKYKMEKANFRLAFKSCWHHFVLYSGSFRFFKVDVLAALVRDDLFNNLKESLKFLAQAYSKSHYLFFLFYCRFIVKVLDFIDDNIDNRIMVWKILELLAPSNIPGFVAQFIEILNHNFIAKYFERNEAFWIAKELIEAVKWNESLEPLVSDFVTKNFAHLKRFSIYLSFLCPQMCVNLKNIFNQSRPKVIEKGANSFFNTIYLLTKQTRPFSKYCDLVDHLCDNPVTNTLAIESIKSMIDRKISLREVVLLLMIRFFGKNVPLGVRSACEEIFKRNDVREIVCEYENKFFNKI
ncbi:uncharacterized protein VICG_00445 [Vittaforma corneae ATCC 50505]|uniref:Uncharacterized protein n=1 Tax=Vittaforma corneae (strain ATCC 50505) TaxID=993615 RepID=L2GPU7_VITCO|nr:uncharacterized protein VICG_00445 [Vittaforma corneae ATCC 50505]ELA42347.1 hypothetical protein VICG_00445 [Vittaforma corneae ATCC 50505]